MTEEIKNPTEGANSGLQPKFTEEDMKFFAELKEQKEKEEAEKAVKERRRLFLNEVKSNTGDEAWKALASVKDKNGKTIEDLFNEKPHLLDDTAMTASAIDIFKTIAETQSNSNSQGDPAQRDPDKSPADPSNSGAGGGNYNPPDDIESFLKDVRAGKVSREDIVNSKLGKTEQLMLMRLQASGNTKAENAASKFF